VSLSWLVPLTGQFHARYVYWIGYRLFTKIRAQLGLITHN